MQDCNLVVTGFYWAVLCVILCLCAAGVYRNSQCQKLALALDLLMELKEARTSIHLHNSHCCKARFCWRLKSKKVLGPVSIRLGLEGFAYSFLEEWTGKECCQLLTILSNPSFQIAAPQCDACLHMPTLVCGLLCAFLTGDRGSHSRLCLCIDIFFLPSINWTSCTNIPGHKNNPKLAPHREPEYGNETGIH